MEAVHGSHAIELATEVHKLTQLLFNRYIETPHCTVYNYIKLENASIGEHRLADFFHLSTMVVLQTMATFQYGESKNWFNGEKWMRGRNR